MSSEPCPECGAPVGGRDACQKLFDDLGLRAFEDSRYAAMRRLAVDCYACQHDRYIVSGRSLAAHLTGLAVAIEHGGAEQVNERVQSWLSRTRHIEKPTVPRARGKVTIADVAATSAEDYAGAVRRWASSVWGAWREHQGPRARVDRLFAPRLERSASIRAPTRGSATWERRSSQTGPS